MPLASFFSNRVSKFIRHCRSVGRGQKTRWRGPRGTMVVLMRRNPERGRPGSRYRTSPRLTHQSASSESFSAPIDMYGTKLRHFSTNIFPWPKPFGLHNMVRYVCTSKLHTFKQTPHFYQQLRDYMCIRIFFVFLCLVTVTITAHPFSTY